MLNLAGIKEARKMISKPRSVLTLTFIFFLVILAPSATERQEGSIGSMVAAEARERFSLRGDRVGHGRSVQRIVRLDQGEGNECRGRGLIPKNSFCREDVEIWGQGFPAREEIGRGQEKRRDKEKDKASFCPCTSRL